MPSDGRVSNALGVPLPQWIIKQLDKRSLELSAPKKDIPTNDNLLFRGNRSSWVRVVSSVDLVPTDNKKSTASDPIQYFSKTIGLSAITDKSDLAKKFILQGGVSKYTKINDNSFSYTPLGGLNESYNVAGEQEIKEYGYRPMPGITSVKVQTQGKLGSIRSAEIQLKVWDKTQLDIIDALYFKLGYSLFLEWGHTTFYKAGSDELQWGEDFSIDPFSDSNSTKEDIQNKISVNTRNSEGNYDAMMGIVTNFNFSYNQEGGYDCSIKVISLGVLISSTKMNNPRILPDLQDAIVKKLYNRLIELRKQELIKEQAAINAQSTDPANKNAYPPCIRDIEPSSTKTNGPTAFFEYGIKKIVNNTSYIFYADGRYQTSGLKGSGKYECKGDALFINGVSQDQTKQTYEQIIKANEKTIGYLYAPYSVSAPLSVLENGVQLDRFRGSQNLNKPYAYEIKIGSGEYLALNKFKTLVPKIGFGDGIDKLNVQAKIKLPSFAIIENVPLMSPAAVAPRTGFQSSFTDNIPKVTVQKKSVDLLTQIRNVGKNYGQTPIRFQGSTIAINQFIDEGNNEFDKNSSKKYNSYYKSYIEYSNQLGTNELQDYIILLSYSTIAVSSDGKQKSTSPQSITLGSDQDKIRQKILETLNNSEEIWQVINTNFNYSLSSPFSDKNQRIPKILLTLEKTISISLETKVEVDSGIDPTTNKKVKKIETKNVEYKIAIRIDTTDIGIISEIEVKTNLGFTILDSKTLSTQQAAQNTTGTTEESSPTVSVSDIQKSEALKYRSAFEVMIRTIQLYSLNEAIETGGIEKDRKPKKLNLLTKNHYDSFTKKLFSNGLFTPVIDDLQKFSISKDKKNYLLDFENYDKYANSVESQDETKKLLVRSLFGFNFGLMGNKKDSVGIALELYDKNLLVDYNNLFTTCTVPYQFNTGVFEGTQVNHPVYVPFGLVLMILNHACLIYDSNDNKSNKKSTSPMFYIDYNNKTNLCLTSPKQISTNPYDVIIPIQASDSDFASIIEPTVLTSKNKIKAPKEGEQKETPIFSPKKDDLLSYALPEFRDTQNAIDNYRGRTMNILISCDYLLRVVDTYSKANNSGDVYVKEFIEQILFDVNKSLGDFNIFRLAYDDGANTTHVVDDQLSPNLEGNYVTSENKSKLPLFGRASIAKSLEIRTEISSKLSNMLAVSANAQIENTSNLSKNADSYGFYNASYKDRYIPNRTEINNGKKESLPTDTMINSAIQFNSAISTFYGDATPAIDSVGHATNYYIQRMSKLKSEDKGTRSSVMIPVSLNFSIDGISGVGMGHAFTIPEEFLPYTYNLSLTDPYGNADQVNTVGFVTVGLDQIIENNQWTSNFRCNMMYLKKMDDFTAKDMLKKLDENPGSFIESPQGSSLHGEVKDLSKASTNPRNTNQTISIVASANSNYIFGVSKTNIDNSIKSNAHGAREDNQKGQWQSTNAWDLMVPAFTPIYAIFEGKVTNINYLEQGTFIWGYRFTLVGAKDSAFYTHLDRVTVSNGTSVKKGDLLGFVGQPPPEFKWSTHLHIALQRGKLTEFLGSGGQII